MSLFALEQPDVRAEMMWGVYEGAESMERLYPGFHHWTDGDAKGKMHMHTLTTPVIEVAQDGRTAKGVWISPGHETMSFSITPEGESESETPEAYWAWMKYGCDFIKENGEWKIWHLHVFSIFLAGYHTPWTEMPGFGEEPPPMPDEYLPDRPPTTGWNYGRDVVYVNEPAPPAPYETFDGADAF